MSAAATEHPTFPALLAPFYGESLSGTHLRNDIGAVIGGTYPHVGLDGTATTKRGLSGESIKCYLNGTKTPSNVVVDLLVAMAPHASRLDMRGHRRESIMSRAVKVLGGNAAMVTGDAIAPDDLEAMLKMIWPIDPGLGPRGTGHHAALAQGFGVLPTTISVWARKGCHAGPEATIIRAAAALSGIIIFDRRRIVFQIAEALERKVF